MKLNARAAQRGFSLIELMVGMAIGLLCTLVIATVLSSAEGMRRGTTAGADAQINGTLALYAVQREVAMAGYGFASEAATLGCPLSAFFNGAAVTVLPAQLAPVLITQGVNGASDQIRVVASSKQILANNNVAQVGYSVPLRVTAPVYTPVSTGYSVWSNRGVLPGDLMIAVIGADQPCELFQATAVPANGKSVTRGINAALWNPAGFPTQTTTTTGSMLVNMGTLVDVIFSVDATQRLVSSTLNTTTLQRNVMALQSNIVLFKSLYGRDTNADGAVDVYDYRTPTNSAEWAQVLSVRMAVVARSAQYERDEVTTTAPTWVVGKAAAVTGAVDCGESACVSLPLTGLADWKHYRYKVFDTVVPLRNQRWKS